jgi:glucan phosphoethanolaminetransferase (alkaline phosphatase superfamily)
MTGQIACTILSFSFVGTLIAFFYFNVFSKTYKIFLGDTGSMVIGFVMGVLACRFLQLELVVQETAKIVSAPTVVCGVLIIPLFDSLRVFILRIKQGRSPFKADHQHIHHRLLQLGCSHLQATLVLISVNLFFIVLSYLLRGIGIVWLMGVILGLAVMMSHILVTYAKEKSRKELDSVISVYFAVKMHQYRNRKIEIAEKQPIRIPIYNPPEKVHAVMN